LNKNWKEGALDWIQKMRYLENPLIGGFTYQCLIGIAAEDRTLLVEMGNG
jgi:hypothetical protein